MKYVVIIIGILSILNSAEAQSDVMQQRVLWTKYHLHYTLNDNWSISHFGDERTFISPVRRHMFLGSIAGVRKLENNLSLIFDFQYARFTLPHDPEVTSTIHRWELRPTVGVNYAKNLNEKWKLSNRLALENRFFRPINDDGTLDKSSFEFTSWRLRNKLQFSYNINTKWAVHIMDEYMIHDGPNTPSFFDQNRIGATTTYRVSDLIGLEAGYLNWYQRKPNPDEFFSRHSWRLILHLYF